MDNDPDKKLKSWLENYKKGDNSSYKKFLNELGIIAERFLISKISDPEDREECVQDILIAVHTALPNFDESLKILPWFFSIVRFKAIDRLRKIYKEKSIPVQYFEDISNFSYKNYEQSYSSEEEKDILEEALSCLDPYHRKALELAKLQGMPLKEIALEMEWTLSKTKVVIHRSMEKLKHFMRGKNGKNKTH